MLYLLTLTCDAADLSSYRIDSILNNLIHLVFIGTTLFQTIVFPLYAILYVILGNAHKLLALDSPYRLLFSRC